MVVCIKHKSYRGKTQPDLNCKACCHVYIQAIKKRANKMAEDFPKSSESSQNDSRKSFPLI